MTPDEPASPTLLCDRIEHADDDAARRLMPVVYEQLRALAGSYFRNQPREHTLQPTALVHEAFLKLVDNTGVSWRGRAHFFATCARAMRQILTDHARRSGAAKRGGDRARLTLTGRFASDHEQPLDIVMLDELLTGLADRSERQAHIVEYRFFAGMTMEEVACALGVSLTTVEKDWRVARAWLGAELAGEEAGP
ncbi:MAG: ECF-type sigma factor [Planctomycetota bacterium]|jgi:RNA polymerase sigma factor (TIGR02999 family)